METTLGQVKALREEQPQASVAAFKGAFKLRPKDAQEPAHKEQSRNIPEIRNNVHNSRTVRTIFYNHSSLIIVGKSNYNEVESSQTM